MKFVQKPSLEHMSLVRTVSLLWNQQDVKELISMFSVGNSYLDLRWETMEKMVTEKVPQLKVPLLIKEKILGLIKPIGQEIFKWMEFHFTNDLPINLPDEFCWTPSGTIDQKGTAKLLIKNANFDTDTCYKIACVYCLEEDIDKFWNNISDELKQSFSGQFLSFEIIRFWTHIKREVFGNDHIDFKYLVSQSLSLNNKVAAEYFLQKLTPQERDETLLEAAKDVTGVDMWHFLLSEINQEQQIEVFEKHAYRVLCCFLQWPFQSFFIEIANSIWDFLSEEHYNKLLGRIFHKCNDGCKDFDYEYLFKQFWKESPSNLKNSVTDEIHNSWILQRLFYVKDKDKIKLLFKDISHTAKKNFIYSEKMSTFCEISIRDNEWDFLEFCIRECSPSKDEILKFKNEYENRMMHPFFKSHFTKNKQKWEKLFSFSDNSNISYNKRSAEEAESSSSKRLHNPQ